MCNLIYKIFQNMEFIGGTIKSDASNLASFHAAREL